MTNQPQPLTLNLSNGQEVSIEQAKSVLRYTENGQQRSCAIVRGPAGAAIYNQGGDVEINGAPSTAHWLQPGDTLQFGNSLSASVEQLGDASEALNSLLNEVQPEVPVSPVAAAPAAMTPAPISIETDQETFTPATAANYTPEPQPAPAPVEPTAPAAVTETPVTETPVTAPAVTTQDQPTTVAELAIPVASAATLAALGVATISAEPSVESVATPAEPKGFTPATNAFVDPVAPPAAELETAPPTTGFAAELLARIQADDNNDRQNENETVGITTSETTHSPLAADGHSFSSPTADSNSISSLIPELPSASAIAPIQNEQPEDQPNSLDTSSSTPVETSTAESVERQSQSSSVSALLERMKEEGQWGGLSEEEMAPAATTDTNETPVLDEADEDVQSYMSQLLSRMRDPDEEQPQQPVAVATATPKPAQPEPEVIEAPKQVGLLKPEEYIPKTKARRLDSLQDMRALANTQTRTAIRRSQAKRREATMGSYNLAIAVVSCVVAAVVFLFNLFGVLSFTVAMIAMISGAFYCCKTFFSELLEAKKNNDSATPHVPVQAEPADMPHEGV